MWCKEEPTVVVTERSLPGRERRSLLAGRGLAVLLLSPEGWGGRREEEVQFLKRLQRACATHLSKAVT